MIKSCVIGLSKIGQIHCSNLKKIKKTELSYVYDVDPDLRKKISKKYNCLSTSNFNSILKDKSIKLFIIASPTTTHEYYLTKLINHKKMIYCEKPISLDSNKINLLIKKITVNKIKICIGLNRRYSNPYIKMKNILKNRKVKIAQIISRSFKANVNQSVRNGGLFMDKGFHFFDLANWFVNSIPKNIVTIAKSISRKEFLDKKDFSDAIINMKFGNGSIVEFIFSRTSRNGHEERIKLFGNNFIIDSDKYFRKNTLYRNFDIKHKDSYLNCLKDFIYKDKTILLNEGIQTQRICSSVLKSAQKNNY